MLQSSTPFWKKQIEPQLAAYDYKMAYYLLFAENERCSPRQWVIAIFEQIQTQFWEWKNK
jgi:hypothetical protein